MTTRDLLMHEMQQVPEALLGEILDFVRFVKAQRTQERLETAMVSEAVLAKDWLRPEEDAAWQDL
jgi:hypothetical protein